MRKRKLMTLCSVVGLIGAVTIGGTVAYMTDNEATTNVFSVGEVKIDLTETNLPPDEDDEGDPGYGIPDEFEDMVPNQEVDKNPMITNTGTNDAVVFVQFSIPMAEVITAEDDGTRIDETKVNQELFSWAVADDNGDYTYPSVGEGWVYIKQEYIDENGDVTTDKDEAAYSVYTYGYEEILSKDKETSEIFEKVRLVNVVEGSIEGEILYVPVAAYAIQAENIVGIDTSTEPLDFQTLTDIYTVYVNQSGDLDLSDADESGIYDVIGGTISTGSSD